jgi:hypothetical protein
MGPRGTSCKTFGCTLGCNKLECFTGMSIDTFVEPFDDWCYILISLAQNY